MHSAQGIIPANAEKMARKAVVLMTTKLIDVQQVFSLVKEDRILHSMEPVLGRSVKRVMHKVMPQVAPELWESLPPSVQAEICSEVCARSPVAICSFLRALKAEVRNVLDIEELVVEKLGGDPCLINEVFRRCGEAEFRFIEKSGLYFGFLLGLLQAAAWAGAICVCFAH